MYKKIIQALFLLTLFASVTIEQRLFAADSNQAQLPPFTLCHGPIENTETISVFDARGEIAGSITFHVPDSWIDSVLFFGDTHNHATTFAYLFGLAIARLNAQGKETFSVWAFNHGEAELCRSLGATLEPAPLIYENNNLVAGIMRFNMHDFINPIELTHSNATINEF